MKVLLRILGISFLFPAIVFGDILISSPIQKSRYGCKIDDELGTFELIKFPRKSSGTSAAKAVTPSAEKKLLKGKIRKERKNGNTSRVIRLKKHLRDIKELEVACAELALEAKNKNETPPPPTVSCDYIINTGESLNKFSSIAQPGQIVCVKAGTYTETLRPEVSGTAGHVITFRANPGDECKGAFAGTKSDCRVIIDGQTSRDTAVDLGNRNYIRVEGFDIRNHTQNGVTNFVDWYASTSQTTGNQIVNNYIHDNKENGVNSDNSNGALIENNEIFRNGYSAIKNGGQSGCVNLIGRGNNIHYNVKDGFDGGLRNNGLVEYNIIYDQFHTDAHQDGIDLSNASNLIIRYNTIWDLTQLIYLDSDEDPAVYSNIQIYGNILFKNNYPGDSPAIFISLADEDNANNINIHSNTCGWLGGTSDNPYKCIEVYGNVKNLTIRNNIAYDSKFAIEPTDPNQFTSDYNLFYASSPDLIESIQRSMVNNHEGSHSLVSDPQFVNYQRRSAWDFRLKSTSPAINRGVDLSTIFTLPSPFVDIAGVQRPEGANYDIGAYEFKP